MSCRAQFACLALGLMVLSAPAAAATITDDFNDNSMAAAYALIQDDPNALWLEETNQRLELRSSGPGSPINDALYITAGSSGYQLLTSSDFQITLDFGYTAFSGTGSIILDLGIGRDLDGKDSAAVVLNRSSTALLDLGLGVAWRVSDVQQTTPLGSVNPTGTFEITYDATLDRLALGVAGGLTKILDGLVKGQWNADQVWVSFGGRGDGLVLATGDAYLDNLLVDGEWIPVPEPATLTLLALGAATLLRKKR